MKWIFWPNKNGDIEMAFTDEELKFTLQKTQEIQRWAHLARSKQRLPSGYPDTLTYRLSIISKLNLRPILDRLRLDAKDGYAKQIEDARDNLISEVENYEKNYDKNDLMHLPDFSLCDTADRLVILLRKVFNDETDDSKKLSMYADNIEDLASDDLTLYPAICNKQFDTLLNIAVGYDLFDALLDRIEEKDKASGAQLKAKYQQLNESFDVENAQEKELKAIKSAAFNMVSLMKKITEQAKRRRIIGRIVEVIIALVLLVVCSYVFGVVTGIFIFVALLGIFSYLRWLEPIKVFIEKIV